MNDHPTRARRGAVNLVRNCAMVKSGQRVVSVNDSDLVEPALGALLAETVTAEGARCESVWIAMATASPDRLAEALRPAADADVVIASVRNITPLATAVGESRAASLVGNLFHTVEGLASEHAGTHWGFVQAIYTHVEALLEAGRRWRITGPSGTELTGSIGKRSSRAAYLEDETFANQRLFHARAWCPTAVADSAGTVCCQFTGGPRRIPCDEPPMFVFEDNRLAQLEGGSGAANWISEYETALSGIEDRFGDTARILDSFHGGCHPRAEYAQSLLGNGCTRNLHFHIGRTTGRTGDYVAAEIGPYSLELDGRTLFRDGKLAILDDPAIQAAAQQFGLPNPMAA